MCKWGTRTHRAPTVSARGRRTNTMTAHWKIDSSLGMGGMGGERAGRLVVCFFACWLRVDVGQCAKFEWRQHGEPLEAHCCRERALVGRFLPLKSL